MCSTSFFVKLYFSKVQCWYRNLPCLVSLQTQSFPREYSLICLTCFLWCFPVGFCYQMSPWVISLRLQGAPVWPAQLRAAEDLCQHLVPLTFTSHPSLPGTSLVLSPSPITSSVKLCQWALLLPEQRLSSLAEKDESHLMPACLVLHRPSHCQNPQNAGSDTSHEAMY